MEENQNKEKDKFYIQVLTWMNMYAPFGGGNVQLVPGQSGLVCISRKKLQIERNKIHQKYLSEIGDTEPITNHKCCEKVFVNIGENYLAVKKNDPDFYYTGNLVLSSKTRAASNVLYLDGKDINFNEKVEEIFKDHISESGNFITVKYKPFMIRVDDTNFYFILTHKQSRESEEDLEKVFEREINTLKEYIGFGFNQYLEDTEFIFVR